ncbi:MAG TPA: phosphoglycerate mutase family protein, partial [Candidatus Eisenbacteria bacterium]
MPGARCRLDADRHPSRLSRVFPTRLILISIFVLVGAATAQTPPSPAPPASTPPADRTVRTLYLIRHGIYDSADERPDSVGKALTPLGIAQIRLAAARLRGMPVTFTSIRSSRLTRAWESARVLAADFPNLTVRPT